MKNPCAWPSPSHLRPLPECPRLPPCECEREPICPPPRRQPPRPAPRIVCCGQESQRCMPIRLRVCGLPCGLCPPLTLVSITALTDAVTVCVKETACGPFPIAEVRIPLCVQVRDARCITHSGNAEVTIPVRLSRGCGCAGGTFLACADVRLANPGVSSCEPEFCVQIAARAEVYMARMECFPSPCAPFWNMPLFPQPYYLSGGC